MFIEVENRKQADSNHTKIQKIEEDLVQERQKNDDFVKINIDQEKKINELEKKKSLPSVFMSML